MRRRLFNWSLEEGSLIGVWKKTTLDNIKLIGSIKCTMRECHDKNTGLLDTVGLLGRKTIQCHTTTLNDHMYKRGIIT